jgi:hypothetical protein
MGFFDSLIEEMSGEHFVGIRTPELLPSADGNVRRWSDKLFRRKKFSRDRIPLPPACRSLDEGREP